MEFRIRENKIGYYIDLFTDNGLLIIEGSNRYMFEEDAKNAINAVKPPVVYITGGNEKQDDYDRNMTFSKDDNYPSTEYDSPPMGGFKDW